jgi:molybdenum cofactor cytidylyltransferase
MSPYAPLDSLGASGAGPLPVRPLVLAAGKGLRFGGGKLLASYRGRPLLSHVLEVIGAACERRILKGGCAIISAEDQDSRALVERAGLEAVLNDAPGQGLSHSLQLGLAALERRKPGEAYAGAALVFLADQPLVRLDVVEELVAAWRAGDAGIFRPRYAARPDTPGHPVLLNRSVWHLAHQLDGDHGFAGLANQASVRVVTLDVPGDNPDIDTPADLQALEEPTR